MVEEITEFNSNQVPFSWRRVGIGVLASGLFLMLVFIGLYFWEQSYANRVIPGIVVGGVPVGGLERGELTDWFHATTERLMGEGLHFSFQTSTGEKHFVIYPSNATEDTSVDLMHIDVPTEVNNLLLYGKGPNDAKNIVTMLRGVVRPVDLSLSSVTLDPEKIHQAILDEIAPYETAPVSASIHFSSLDPVAFTIASSAPGIVFSDKDVMTALKSAWDHAEVPTVTLTTTFSPPEVVEADLAPYTDRIARLVTPGALTLQYTDPVTNVPSTWTVSASKIAAWLEVHKAPGGELHFGLSHDVVVDWLHRVVEPDVTVAAQNARFQVDKKGKVVEFQGSRTGQSLDVEATWAALDAAVNARLADDSGAPKFIQATVTQVTPDVSTSAANNLGITDILGTGVSKFTGSPVNRIKNIKNGVAKINGLLIKPGEEFSTVKYTQPYTLEGGYLPELAIEGNKVEPALGGGLCQISTTLFRMAMNSGLEITERHNHSLLVAYYNDLVNNMPGTDATIFEPSPDFKFKNDTNNYILIQADMDEKKSTLTFTLWGTSDGRTASYTHPTVKRFIPYSTTPRVTETTSLPPGQKKCQQPYQGAEASFTYTRTLANGEKQDKVFNSYYRPLPEICLVGAASSTPATTVAVGPGTESSTPVVIPD